MKTKLYVIITLLISQTIFCQKKEKVKPIYIDKCTNLIVENILHESISEFNDFRFVSGLIEKEDGWGGRFYIYLDLSEKYDTLYIPKILNYHRVNMVESTAKGFKINDDTIYKKCDVVCNGLVTEYNENNGKFFEGKFNNGKPIEIKEYDLNGIIAIHEYFKVGELNSYKTKYFDNFGKLTEYKIFKTRKNKTITKTYNANGKLINKDVFKHDF